MTDKNVILETITPNDIIKIVSKLGGNLFREKENELWFNTICHGGGSHKLCYYKNSKRFYCYTNCGAMNIFQFIMTVMGCTFVESIQFIDSIIYHNNHTFGKRKPFRDSTLDTYRNLRHSNNRQIEFNHIDKALLDYFDKDYFYSGWTEEFITEETMKEFNIEWYDPDKYIIIPHFDIDNNLIGIRRRSLKSEDINKGCKYMPLYLNGTIYNHPLGYNLYGLNKHKSAISKAKKAIITEGEKSVLQGHSYYGNDCIIVAACGFNLSNEQINLLLKSGAEEITIAFDKDFKTSDKGYETYYNKILSLVKKITPYCTASTILDTDDLLEIKNSPTDKGKEVFEKLYENRIYFS